MKIAVRTSTPRKQGLDRREIIPSKRLRQAKPHPTVMQILAATLWLGAATNANGDSSLTREVHGAGFHRNLHTTVDALPPRFEPVCAGTCVIICTAPPNDSTQSGELLERSRSLTNACASIVRRREQAAGVGGDAAPRAVL